MSYGRGKGTEDAHVYGGALPSLPTGAEVLCAAVTEARGQPGTGDFASCPDGAEPTPGAEGAKQALTGPARPRSRAGGKPAAVPEPLPSQPRRAGLLPTRGLVAPGCPAVLRPPPTSTVSRAFPGLAGVVRGAGRRPGPSAEPAAASALPSGGRCGVFTHQNRRGRPCGLCVGRQRVRPV